MNHCTYSPRAALKLSSYIELQRFEADCIHSVLKYSKHKDGEIDKLDLGCTTEGTMAYQEWTEPECNPTWYEKQHGPASYIFDDQPVAYVRSGRKRQPLEYQ